MKLQPYLSDEDPLGAGLFVLLCKNHFPLGVCHTIDTDAKTFRRHIMPGYEGPFFGEVFTHPDPKFAQQDWREERGTYDEIFVLEDGAPPVILSFLEALGIPVYRNQYAAEWQRAYRIRDAPPPPAEEEECQSCKKQPGERNHPPGMIFIGWGRGWERCPTCDGTQKVPKGTAYRPARCCPRDDDGDGNCDIHESPGVLRQPRKG